jgi:hypothetical protein
MMSSRDGCSSRWGSKRSRRSRKWREKWCKFEEGFSNRVSKRQLCHHPLYIWAYVGGDGGRCEEEARREYGGRVCGRERRDRKGKRQTDTDRQTQTTKQRQIVS